jgi:hypothetical protein
LTSDRPFETFHLLHRSSESHDGRIILMKMLKLMSIVVPALALAPTPAWAAETIAAAPSSVWSMLPAAGSDYAPTSIFAKDKFGKGSFGGPDGPMTRPIILVAVPEPAAWGMMIAGVGFAGFRLRGLRKRALARA